MEKAAALGRPGGIDEAAGVAFEEFAAGGAGRFKKAQRSPVAGEAGVAGDEIFFGKPKDGGERGDVGVREPHVAGPSAAGTATAAGRGGVIAHGAGTPAPASGGSTYHKMAKKWQMAPPSTARCQTAWW